MFGTKLTRFETVAVKILDMSPTSALVNKKAILVGDAFSRFVVAVPVEKESAEGVAELFFERWIAVFGPPV